MCWCVCVSVSVYRYVFIQLRSDETKLKYDHKALYVLHARLCVSSSIWTTRD